MKQIIFSTNAAINIPALARMNLKDPNARAIFDAVEGTGIAADPYREQLLNATITIDNPLLESEAVAKFTFPTGKETEFPVQVSDYKLADHEPIIITFAITCGKIKGAYKLTKDMQSNNWWGHYIYDDKPMYVLKGTCEQS